MTNYREILRLRSLGLNNSQISQSAAISRPTVIATVQRAAVLGLDWRAVEGLSDKELAEKLIPPGIAKLGYKMPDYEQVHRELAKPGVTQELLWMEYSEKCRAAGEIPYQLTQFKTYYRAYVAKTKATMHIQRKPGELMEADWAGQTSHLVDPDTGEVLDAFVFVAALPYSGYAYAEAFMTQNQEAWIAAHVNSFNFYGGVAKILVPDNLKTGVIKNTSAEVQLNRTYQELAEHYATAIIPARVRAPRDKATVEGTVGDVSTFILATIRNQTFFSLKELNDAIREKLHAFNHKSFQKKEGSRATWFAEERAFLIPLPRNAYEMSTWKKATVAFNYHINVDKHYYSVPFNYIKRVVDIRLTKNIVEVFLEGTRLCSHARLYGYELYSTKEEHMPLNHQQYLNWNGDRFRKWAEKIGQNTSTVVGSILAGYKVEQQGYLACMALLKLSDKYTSERLESACAKALHYTPRPNYKSIQTILKSGIDKLVEEQIKSDAPSGFGYTRGADYYKGGGGQ
jgi:transposase